MPTDFAALEAAIGRLQPTAPPPLEHRFGRDLKNIANLPENIVEGLAQSGTNLMQMGNPWGITTKVEVPHFFDIAPPQTTSEHVSDFLVAKGGLADIVGQSLVPAGIAGKIGAVAGVSEGAGMEALKWAAGFAGPELGREDANAGDVGVATAIGGIQGGLSILPRKARILPTALMAGAHGLYEAGKHDATTGLIAFGADMVGGLIPGAHPDTVPTNQINRQGMDQGFGQYGPSLDINNPQSVDQHILYKQQLTTLQNEGLARQAEQLQYEQGARGSLKEGGLINFAEPPSEAQKAAMLPEVRAGLQHTDRVNTGDFLASFDQSLPDRMSTLGIVERKAIYHEEPKGPLEWEPSRPTDYEPTVGQAYLGLATLQEEGGATGPIEGVLPRFFRPLFTGEDAPNPSALFPVEGVGGGPRSAEEIAAMQKAMKVKKSRAPKKEVQASTPPEEPIKVDAPEEPTKIDAPEDSSAPATLSTEEADYQRKQFAKQTPEQLRGVMSFYDEQIADTLDPQSKSHYYALKQMAQNALDRATPQVEASLEPSGAERNWHGKGKKEQQFAKDQSVIHTDIFGQEQHGVYKGKTADGRAKVLFNGEKDTTLLSHGSLKESTGEIPEIATLQKLKEGQKPTEVFTKDDESFLSKWLAGEEDAGNIPHDDIDPSIEGQDFNFETRVSNDGKVATMQTSLPKSALQAIDKVVTAVKNSVNKNLRIAFIGGEHFKPGVPALSDSKGHIKINRDKLIELFDNWHRAAPEQKAQSLAEVARWLGHEAGHTILNFIGIQDKRLMGKLMSEFRSLGESGRELIMKDFHDFLGKSDTLAMRYASGTDVAIEWGYGFHGMNKEAVEFMGLHEFFAEMSAAHIFGKLKEEFLPPEIKSLWGKFKDLMRNVIGRLFHDPMEDMDEILAYKNFKEILGKLHDRFSLLSKEEMEQLSKSSEPLVREKWDKFAARELEIKRKIDLENYDAAYSAKVRKDRASAQSYIENPDYIPGAEEPEFATLQNTFNAAPIFSKPIIGAKGFIESEIARHLGLGIAGGIIGGIAGPRLSNQQMTVAQGVFAGAVLGLAGPIALRRLFMTMPSATGSTFHHMPAKEAFKKLFTLSDLTSLGGDAATGQGSAPAKFVRWLERNMNLHLPAELFNAVVKSEGPASYAVQIASDAFEKARTFKTNPMIDTAVENFLRGGPVADLRRVLGMDADAVQFGNFIVTGRESIGLLQEMFVSGLKDGSFKNKIVDSLAKGDYLTRQYKMFHDVNYKPTQVQIEAVAMELTHAHPDYDMSTSRQLVEDYLHQIETERGMFSGGRGDVGQKLDAAIFQKKNDRLSAAFRDALGEYKDPKERIMGTVRHLYTNAISAKFYDQVSSMTDKLGLKMSYGASEHGAAIDTIKARLLHPPAGTTPEQIAMLQKQMKELGYYVPLENSVRYGKLGGKMVNRFVRDHLASFDSPWGLMDGSIMRTLSNFHNQIKIGRTALNPITVIRNIVAAPILMGLARANPIHALPGGVAWKAMRDLTSPMAREMLQQGIFGVDQVRSEFFRATEQIMTGDYDHHGLTGIFKSGMNKVLEFYRAPDILVRGATYVSAKAKFAEKFGLPESHQMVIDAARDWTNRYTVNYQNVAPIVKSLRQVPFSNLFISYTAEITRIAKNLTMDIFQHPDAGQRVFAAGAIGGLTAIPFLMEKASIGALSPKDREEWERSQAQMPDYSRSRFRVVLGKDGNRFRYIDITPLLQIDSLLQMMRTVGQRDVQGFLAVNPVFGWENTPAANIVAEQISGKDLHTGRDISGSVSQRMLEVMKEVVPPIVPGGYEFERAADSLSLTDQGDRGVSNLRTGRRTTPGELVTSYLTGMRLTTVDTSYLHRNTVADAKRQIANEASYFRDVASTNLPDEVKKKAAARYEVAVKGILADMQSKLDGKLP